MNNIQKIIAEYPEEYCLFLEATYAQGHMSEGGTHAIDNMFIHMDLHQKHMLEIGFGLGGAAFHLAEKHQAKITGIEVNPWMVEEATRRIPETLKQQVNFVNYEQPPLLPFEDHAFDVVFSKGVLVHVADKLPLFKEVQRVLKPGGYFIVDDWLSPQQGVWSKKIQALCELENLSLFAESESHYQSMLSQAGFNNIVMRDENNNYVAYNQAIINRLNDDKVAVDFQKSFGEQSWREAIEGYQLIADSFASGELLVRWIACEKADTFTAS